MFFFTISTKFLVYGVLSLYSRLKIVSLIHYDYVITLKKWDKLLFLSYSPAIRAKDLLFGSDNVKYWCFIRCPFRFSLSSLLLRYNCFGHYLMKLHYMDTLKSLLTMIQHMHCLLVFRKMSFPIHFNFSPLACMFFYSLF